MVFTEVVVGWWCGSSGGEEGGCTELLYDISIPGVQMLLQQ